MGCCNIYGLRKNGTLWRFSDIDDKNFKRFTPKNKSYDGDTELYPVLKSKIGKVRFGMIYTPQSPQKIIKANNDGTLCLLPIKEIRSKK